MKVYRREQELDGFGLPTRKADLPAGRQASMDNVSFYLKHTKKLLGFTRTGASVVGKKLLRLFGRREIRRGVGAGLVAVLTFIFLVHNFSNIGGASVLALNLTGNTPKPVIDATTLSSVQVPITYQYESRGYSWYHAGADLVAPIGTPVRPIMEGKIEETNYDAFGYGKHVIVKHEGGFESIYGHLSKIEVTQGQKVNLDTELGQSGSTGFSTGPHLHLEIHKDGVPIDPAEIVPGIK